MSPQNGMLFLPPAAFGYRARYPRATTSSRPPPRAAAPLPSDTALDMLSFALAGPGLIASGLFALSGLTAVFAFAEVGPRRNARKGAFFFLRVEVAESTWVELLDGSKRLLRAGETVLRLDRREQVAAVARTLPETGTRYSVYRAEGGSMTLISEHPREVNATGGSWPKGVVQKKDEGLLDARWEEYQRIGENEDMDNEWRGVIRGLSPIRFESKGSDCKLCGGSGFTRCHRCGGASKNARAGSTFVCDCEQGRRRCTWCSGGE